jgi:glycerophosphoryl diester phosphodiesterase
MNYWTQSKDNVFVAAHRGWSEKYSENTIEAFKAAIEIGVDQLEMDIRITKDDQLVVIHDAKVDRTTNGTGFVRDFTLAELKELDAGSHKGEEFKGAKIPTLIEFMELIKDNKEITVDFELKEYPPQVDDTKMAEITDRIIKIVDDYGYTDRCVINSFSAKIHEYVHGKYGNKYRQHVFYPIERLGECTIDPYEYAYCACVFGKDSYIAEKEEFEELRGKYGIGTWAGAGVKDAAGVDKAIECGVELITCNNPDVILSLLRERGKHK